MLPAVAAIFFDSFYFIAMPKFCANLSMLFPQVPMAERFALARQAGFEAVEIQFPYVLPKEQIAALLQEHDLHMILHNLPAGDWAAGERGIACALERVDEFKAGVAQAIEYAQKLGVRKLNCLAGIAPAHQSAEQSLACLQENVRYAANCLAQAGLDLLLEPINTYDVPGFFLSRPSQVFALLQEWQIPNLYLQYDLYHAQRMEGELVGGLRRYFDKIGHLQIADNPGRHQPGSGEINFPFLFAEIKRLHYTGYVGCEYLPLGDDRASLAWLQHWRQSGTI